MNIGKLPPVLADRPLTMGSLRYLPLVQPVEGVNFGCGVTN